MRALFLKFDNKFGASTICYYVLVGGISAAINFLTFALFWDIFHLHYKLAVTISYLLAVLFNFLSNRHFTFKSSGENLGYHLYRYLTMIAINYSITISIVHGAVKFFHLSPYLGLFGSIVITAITGFVLSKFWVFAEDPAK